MGKFRSLIESALYIVVGYICQRMARFFYTILVFQSMKMKSGVVYNYLSKRFGLGENPMYYVEITKAYYILFGWCIAIIILYFSSSIRESIFERKILSKSGTINGMLSVLIGFGLVLITITFVGGLRVALKTIVFTSSEGQVSGIGIFSMALTLGIFIPLCEELFFRWFVLMRLKNDFGWWTAIIFQSILFTVMHFNYIQGIYVFLLGMVCGYILLKTRVIINSIIVHMVFNLTNIYFHYILRIQLQMSQLVIAGVIGIGLVFFGVSHLNYTKRCLKV